MEGEPEVLALAPPLKTKPDRTHCALISAETKTDSASAKVTTIFPCPWEASSLVARGRMLQAAADLPALGATGHRARPAPLAGISVLLVPHQGAVVAQALHAVPPVPAAPAEVLEAHLVGGEGGEKPRCQHQQ